MQALIEISDKQFLVQEGDKIFVPNQKAAAGDVLEVKSLMKVGQADSALN
ncbi:MAG TPA: 50S ribosomal protein L21, partial [Chlorobaculum parvum]|nr:50S ribosomal protein L21 [Chlorobaculum parvum]